MITGAEIRQARAARVAADDPHSPGPALASPLLGIPGAVFCACGCLPQRHTLDPWSVLRSRQDHVPAPCLRAPGRRSAVLRGHLHPDRRSLREPRGWRAAGRDPRPLPDHPAGSGRRRVRESLRMVREEAMLEAGLSPDLRARAGAVMHPGDWDALQVDESREHYRRR
jgi:hypothetical protein